ncbi:thermonuclease family protein [Microcoleus sp. B4-C1]|uniref:thermonuclease family protein n=1 Tax=Microcoleus sp. B4-C1 TaxID=2818660 RepID=UPI002FCEFC52
MEIIKGRVYKAEVGFIYDGDSFNLKLLSATGTESQNIICRAQWIDTPESQKPGKSSTDPRVIKHWEWAEKAKLALMNLIQNRALIAIPYEVDQYQRWVCDVYLDNLLVSSNVQVKLAQSGFAVSRLPFNRHIYNVRETTVLRSIIAGAATANRKRIGVWSQSNMILPYEFKKLSL